MKEKESEREICLMFLTHFVYLDLGKIQIIAIAITKKSVLIFANKVQPPRARSRATSLVSPMDTSEA